MADKIKITEKTIEPRQAVIALPRDVFDELCKIRRKTGRTIKEIAGELLRFALDHVEY